MIVDRMIMREKYRYKYRNDYGNICINGYVYMGTYIDRYCLRTILRSCYAILAGFYFCCRGSEAVGGQDGGQNPSVVDLQLSDWDTCCIN